MVVIDGYFQKLSGWKLKAQHNNYMIYDVVYTSRYFDLFISAILDVTAVLIDVAKLHHIVYLCDKVYSLVVSLHPQVSWVYLRHI